MFDRDETINGWTAVPANAGKLLFGNTCKINPKCVKMADMEFPAYDKLVVDVQKYAKSVLPEKTYNHSMRVYYFTMAIIKQQFPDQDVLLSPSTVALTALLHDIGTTDEHMSETRMSFEFYGGYKALTLMQELGAAKDQAEAVTEAIIRHQDLGTEGTITFLGQVIQLSTIYDNVGDHPSLPDLAGLIHEDTREEVIKAFPRTGWLKCFAGVVEKEVKLKPWAHTTSIPDFPAKIMSNELMKQYE
ncbi:cyanamide hydratase Ddi3p [Trichomonascus vanleenenianus]|uniref:cyanamide hydratase Ddi3p n=1 Tax=Trichomonascus vanleenenianus TaxID=2268995 RepID=UPI003EC9DD48